MGCIPKSKAYHLSDLSMSFLLLVCLPSFFPLGLRHLGESIVLSFYVYVCLRIIIRMPGVHRGHRGISHPGTGVTDSYELPCWGWDSDQGP